MRNVHPDIRSQPITNIHTRPFPRLSSTGRTTYFSSSSSVGTIANITAIDGTDGIRMTRVDTGALALYNSRGASSLWRLAKNNFKAGDKWTVLFNIRASQPDTSITLQIGQGSGSQSIGGLNMNYTFGTDVTTVRRVFTFTQEHVDLSGTAFLKWQPSSLATVGEWFELSSVMVVKGNYTGSFASGASTNWKWTDEVNNSESIGYPIGGTI